MPDTITYLDVCPGCRVPIAAHTKPRLYTKVRIHANSCNAYKKWTALWI